MRRRNIIGAAAAASLATMLSAAPMASAASDDTTAYEANLRPVALNGQEGATGTYMVTLNGNQATVTGRVSGLAAEFQGGPFPHVQHIHGLAAGQCPTADADADGNGVISTPEARGNYGEIQTTLSTSGDTSPDAGTNVDIAPNGSSFEYGRTITVSDATARAMREGNAEIVVHGLDPATAPAAAGSETSPLVPSLPLAATAPALCGALEPAQMANVPSGGVDTGGGATSGVEHAGLLAGGASALGAAAVVGAFAVRRRRGGSQA